MPSIVLGDRTCPCTGTLEIGRRLSCQIVLPWTGGDNYVSRLHARIAVTPPGEVTLTDLSEAGLFHNDERLRGGTVTLADGDRIRIGVYELVFVA